MDKIKYALAAVALAATAGFASAQETTTQAADLGPSDDPVYTRQIEGANGVIYNCRPNPVTVGGQAALSCVRFNSAAAGGGGTGAGLGGLGGGAAAGIGAVVLVGLAAASDSSSSTTTTN